MLESEGGNGSGNLRRSEPHSLLATEWFREHANHSGGLRVEGPASGSTIAEMSLLDVDLEALLGADAAEDEDEDRLLKYFLKTPTWTAVTDQRRRLRVVVGNKGTGKSAMFRVASREDEEAGRLPVFIRPNDLAGIAEGERDRLKLVRAWQRGLGEVIIANTLRSLGSGDESFIRDRG